MWYRKSRKYWPTWAKFVSAFQDRFCHKIHYQNRLNELRRTQGKGETVSDYIAGFRMIVDAFRRPPSLRTQIQMAYTQLRPDYRKFIDDKPIYDLESIVKHGKQYERHLMWDAQFREPPPASGTRLPATANKGSRGQPAKVAVISESEGSTSASSEKNSTSSLSSKTKKKKKSSSRSSNDEVAVMDVGKGANRPSPAKGQQLPYATVLRNAVPKAVMPSANRPPPQPIQQTWPQTDYRQSTEQAQSITPSPAIPQQTPSFSAAAVQASSPFSASVMPVKA